MRGGRTYVNSRGRIKNKIDLGKIKALLNLIFCYNSNNTPKSTNLYFNNNDIIIIGYGWTSL